MKEKLKSLFDSRVTWTAIGTTAGTLFGDNIALAVNAVGAVVMAFL